MAPFFRVRRPASSAYSISGLRLTQIALMMLPAGKPQKEGNSRGPGYGDNIGSPAGDVRTAGAEAYKYFVCLCEAAPASSCMRDLL
ncbi:hypothetical protein [Bradyrhizobium sp. 195]|uniref:hypothetical protein n=1 Tax=Bradyrhizobium sp. 195 TaxID=2782662 RepID=UPI002000B71A|nr:hypothetical protein [Bradyrhizobium sp. 195]UPK28037.1 hypothetical protein IVB26_05500 [Bradyrhizobium sp. 195]